MPAICSCRRPGCAVSYEPTHDSSPRSTISTSRATAIAVEHRSALESPARALHRAADFVRDVKSVSMGDGFCEWSQAVRRAQRAEHRVVVPLQMTDQRHPDGAGDQIRLVSYALDEHSETACDAAMAEQVREAAAAHGVAIAVLRAREREPSVAWQRLAALGTVLPDTYGADTRAPSELEVRTGPIEKALRNFAGPSGTSLLSWSSELERFAGQVRSDWLLVIDHLLLSIGTQRSRLALVDRFVVRAEAYDRTRLKAIAEADVAEKRREAVLRDELACYLFDEGLSPLTELALTTTRADILDFGDPALLVEAKQYKGGSSDQLALLVQKALLQVFDTAREVAAPVVVREAFVLIFRRDGRRLDVDRMPVRVQDIDVYFRVVNLIDPSKTGSGAEAEIVPMDGAKLRELVSAAECREREIRDSELAPGGHRTGRGSHRVGAATRAEGPARQPVSGRGAVRPGGSTVEVLWRAQRAPASPRRGYGAPRSAGHARTVIRTSRTRMTSSSLSRLLSRALLGRAVAVQRRTRAPGADVSERRRARPPSSASGMHAAG